MKKSYFSLFSIIPISLILLAIAGCSEKGPSRDEIPIIKSLLGQLETATKEHNAARIDSLIIADAFQDGYNSIKFLSQVYPGDSSDFYTLGSREFYYTKDHGVVNCRIMANSADTGRAMEIDLVKKGDRWLIEKFTLK